MSHRHVQKSWQVPTLGPVFTMELRRIARQRAFYALRAALVGGLLVGLALLWSRLVWRMDLRQPSQVARAGEFFFGVIVVGQLSMVLLAAPAATAGAFSTSMARGQVGLMLVAGLTPLEIVLGTLAARLVLVLGAVACVVPVLALAAQLGGIEPEAIVRLEIVTASCAVVGCTVGLAVSLGATRIHEVLVTTYVLLAGWVFGYPVLIMIRQTALGRLVPAPLVGGFLSINPYAVTLVPLVRPGSAPAGEGWALLVGALAVSLAVAVGSAWRVRAAAQAAPGGRPHRSWIARRLRSWQSTALDTHPVYWRECRRQQPSRWIRLLWALYAAGALGFSLMAVYECVTTGVSRNTWTSPFNGFQATVGLLLLSVVAPASLAEERASGGLDVLLSTPLSSRSLVLGKWFALYRVVPVLALLPVLVAAAHAAPHGRWSGVLLVAGMVLACGAAINSLGIALATWVPRLDLALTLSAAAAILLTVVWPIVTAFLTQGGSLGLRLVMASPMVCVGVVTGEMANSSPSSSWGTFQENALFWIVVHSAIGIGLLGLTLATFDACVGRIRPRKRRAVDSSGSF